MKKIYYYVTMYVALIVCGFCGVLTMLFLDCGALFIGAILLLFAGLSMYSAAEKMYYILLDQW